MRLMSVGAPGAETPAVEADDGHILDLSGVLDGFDATFWARGGPSWLAEVAATRDLPLLSLHQPRLGAPVPRPGTLVCVGLNYAEHAREAGAQVPAEPVLFLKATNTIAGPYDDLACPPGSTKLDYEVELAVVIGQEVSHAASPTEAVHAVGGYVLSHDVSERALQFERGGQWTKGKSSKGFNPLGPYLVPDLEPATDHVHLWLHVNGQVRQDSSTSEMIFDVAYLVWYVSQFMTLEPGDVINTGTPAGVGHSMSPPSYLYPGDVVELGGGPLGTQRQRIVTGR